MRYNREKSAENEQFLDSESLFDIEPEPPMPNSCSLLLAAAAGGVTNCVLTKTVKTPINNVFTKALKGTSRNNNFKRAALEAFQQSSLIDKGCKMMSPKEIKEHAKPIVFKPGNDWKAALSNAIKRIYTQPSTKEVYKGTNAFYNSLSKEIAVNTNKKAVCSFHEMGHALNANTKGIGKVLANLKYPAAIILLIATLSAYRKKKSEGETSDNIFGKGLDFAKEHCVGLTAAATLPNLLEEGLASIKGYKLAKNKLPSAQLKTMSKLYGKAWMTYLAQAVISVGFVYVVDKVRNMTSEKSKH